MSPEIGGWNPAFVFGVAVLAAVVVIGWMWTGSWRRMMADFKANWTNFARDFVVGGIIVWVPWLAWRFGWVSSRAAVVIGLVLLIGLGVVNAIRRRRGRQRR
jgi:hypothetical protein